jgi:predicted nucleotidyltransferase
MIPNCSPPVETYISSVIRACEGPDSGIISAVLFGSAATGSYSPEISDVDLLIVLHDGATEEDRSRARDTISDYEDRSGVGKRHPHRRGALDSFADRVTANVRSFFVCTRADLLSGEPGRILGISTLQAFFVDRVAIPSILASGITIWGEHLTTCSIAADPSVRCRQGVLLNVQSGAFRGRGIPTLIRRHQIRDGYA